jgi:hypothetical protein
MFFEKLYKFIRENIPLFIASIILLVLISYMSYLLERYEIHEKYLMMSFIMYP